MKLGFKKNLLMIFTSVIFFLSATISLIPAGQEIWTSPIFQIDLENGLKVLFEKDDSSQITVIRFDIKGGKLAESKSKQGLSYITTRLALEIPDRQKAQDFMLQATQFTMFCENDYSAVVVTCLSENLKDSLVLISDIMLNPLFSSIRIKRIKENMLNRDKIEQDVSRNMAFQAVKGSLFKETAYDGSVYGNEDSLKQIGRKDITGFYEKYFTSNNILITVSSDLNKEVITEYLNQCFSPLKTGPSFVYKEVMLPLIDQKTFQINRDTQQTFISIGYRLPPINKSNYVQALMIENLVGKGIGSRLWPLREEKKLAYNVSAEISYYRNGGMLEALMETENVKKMTALEAIRHALDSLYLDGIDSQELEMTKEYTKASFLRSNETKSARTATLAFFEIMDLGLDFFKNIFGEIDGISLEEMNSYIHEILDPAHRIEVTIGPE